MLYLPLIPVSLLITDIIINDMTRRCIDSVAANQVITEAIHSQTELGKRTDEILLRGESVPEELAVKLLEEKILSPEVAHHGKVIVHT